MCVWRMRENACACFTTTVPLLRYTFPCRYHLPSPFYSPPPLYTRAPACAQLLYVCYACACRALGVCVSRASAVTHTHYPHTLRLYVPLPSVRATATFRAFLALLRILRYTYHTWRHFDARRAHFLPCHIALPSHLPAFLLPCAPRASCCVFAMPACLWHVVCSSVSLSQLSVVHLCVCMLFLSLYYTHHHLPCLACCLYPSTCIVCHTTMTSLHIPTLPPYPLPATCLLTFFYITTSSSALSYFVFYLFLI